MSQLVLARAAFVCTGLALLVACSDQAPTGPTALEPSLNAAMLSAPTGNPYVHFLQPIAAAGEFTGTFDGTLAPEVVIYLGAKALCPSGVNGADCATEVARFSSADKGARSVRVDLEEQHYVANWKLDKSLDPAATYRVLVRVGEQVLDYTDVTEIKGGTLPIKFRIERGALDIARVPVGNAGGTVATADGDLTLQIPAGALSGETGISAEALQPNGPGDARVIGGTKYEFGPTGTQFSVPVEVTIQYDPAVLPQGVSPKLLRLHLLTPGGWVPVEGAQVVDETARTVTAQTNHFSTYALLPAAFVSVSAGEQHACGLTSTGEAWCWGRNNLNQLGAATTETCQATFFPGGALPCATTAVPVSGGLQFIWIEAGRDHTCGVTTAKEVYCWGDNTMGQLGTGNTVASSVPVKATSSQDFVSVSAEFLQTCALTGGGDVYCWGQNTQAQLGGPSSETCGAKAVACSTTPLRVPIPTASQVDVGLLHVCATTTASEVYCWGWNALGQIGNGVRSTPAAPFQVTGAYSSVSAGAMHTCAVSTSGAGYCWGTNWELGALGDGTKYNRYLPTAVAGGLSYAQIDAANGNNIYTQSCAVTTGNQAYCWGANISGALGVNTAPDQCSVTLGSRVVELDCALAPIAVQSTEGFKSVTTGSSFTCGYTVGGEVYCWGTNEEGQLGNGSTTGSRTPVLVATAP